jgi:hypothetical protein
MDNQCKYKNFIIIIAKYNNPTLSITTFLNHLLKTWISISCPITIIDDFNIDTLNQHSNNVKGQVKIYAYIMYALYPPPI